MLCAIFDNQQFYLRINKPNRNLRQFNISAPWHEPNFKPISTITFPLIFSICQDFQLHYSIDHQGKKVNQITIPWIVYTAHQIASAHLCLLECCSVLLGGWWQCMRPQRQYCLEQMPTQVLPSLNGMNFTTYFQCVGVEIVKITVATRRSNLLLRAAPLPGERLWLKENNSHNGDLYPLLHIWWRSFKDQTGGQTFGIPQWLSFDVPDRLSSKVLSPCRPWRGKHYCC